MNEFVCALSLFTIMTGEMSIAEIDKLPSREYAAEQYAKAQAKVDQVCLLMSLSPSRAHLPQYHNALRDAEWRKSVWNAIYRCRSILAPPRIQPDYDNGPAAILYLRELIGDDAYYNQRWPDAEGFK